MGKRMKVLGTRRTMVVVTMAVVLLAVAAWVGSGANFSASAPSIGNTFSAGYVEATDGGGVMTVGPMAPGHSYSGTLGVQNTGNLSGDYYLTLDNVTDIVLGSGGESLADQVDVTVTDFAGTVQYSGKLSAMTEVACGALDEFGGATDSGSVTITVTLPDSDAPPATTRGSDNAYMNTRFSADFLWTVVSN